MTEEDRFKEESDKHLARDHGAITELFLREVREEIYRERGLPHSPVGPVRTLTEAEADEAGEVITAIVDGTAREVWAEAVRAAAVFACIAIEGDLALSTLRRRRGADDG